MCLFVPPAPLKIVTFDSGIYGHVPERSKDRTFDGLPLMGGKAEVNCSLRKQPLFAQSGCGDAHRSQPTHHLKDDYGCLFTPTRRAGQIYAKYSIEFSYLK